MCVCVMCECVCVSCMCESVCMHVCVMCECVCVSCVCVCVHMYVCTSAYFVYYVQDIPLPDEMREQFPDYALFVYGEA